MRWTDLDTRDLFDPSALGTHRFADGRTLLLDAGVLSLLLRLPPESPGALGRRQFLRDAGYLQGWRLAGRARALLPTPVGTDVWELAAHGGTWLGLGYIAAGVQPAFPAPLSWLGSPEAGHARREIGIGHETACEFLAGFFGGCASRLLQRAVSCDEIACVAHGHPHCSFRPRADADLTAGELRRLEQLQTLAEPEPERLEEPIAASAEQNPDLSAGGAQARNVVARAKRIAPLDITVLITGETGVGKERLAELVHQHSKRASRRYVPVNCAALPDALLESELFGHRRGAFTGALDDHEGLFEAANHGTIFLDEIGELSLPLQAKLLRVLGDFTIRRVGDTKYRKVDVRVIAATNRDLAREVRENRFREDLLYRLNVVALHVPPLRSRPEELRQLLRTFLENASRRFERQVVGYTPRALKALLSYPWPGNIRELQNVIDSACALAPGSRIDLDDLPDQIRAPSSAIATSTLTARPLRDVERDHILAILGSVQGNRTRAAELLQVSRQTLLRRLSEYGIHTVDSPTDQTDSS